MLSQVENEYLCRVGPATPMGNLMRQYWLPAIRSDELPERDGAPLRVRLLGENLIAFRASSGEVGLLQNHCPHRGASLFFGRNEESGLRCVYHGWKFSVEGECVDMPNEPAESDFRTRVKAVRYPTNERNGIIWAYLGPRSVPPPLPDLEANMLGGDDLVVSIIHRPCNWMQGWEGEMDTVHQAFLHSGATRVEDTVPGTFDYYIASTPAPRFAVMDTAYGTSYGAWRPADADRYYWRIAHMLMPFYAMIPAGLMGQQTRFAAYVPMDDEHTLHWEVGARLMEPDELPDYARGSEAGGPAKRPDALYMPATSDWFGRFNMVQSAANDYRIDRALQRSGKSYTGIPGIRQQDMAVTESMGPIFDRESEHLGTTDALIIRTRRRMISAARALYEDGVTPPGVDEPTLYRQRSGGVLLPRDANWWDATAAQRAEFDAESVTQRR
ncbi:MAG TPA: Rieske 2Fe-2S domain-containing protein [Chloroflexota bacterium]|jgi:phenylpropionate dioxygenase-like ring-hydroxylating dioxygenase large terminal subunit|nr:Rieske 2Fe-2S domain-containing protein [Chloroflexota bacterium]